MFTTFCGHRELGKSTLAYWLLRKSSPRLIWDVRCFWRSAPGRIVYGDVHGDRPLHTWPGLESAWREYPEVVIQPDNLDDPDQNDWTSLTRELRYYVRQHPRAQFAVLVDEYGLTLHEGVAQNHFNWFAKTCDRARVDIYVTCHKPVDIHPKVRSVIDRWAIFQTVERNDLEMLTKWCGRSADELRSMPPYVCWWWDHGKGAGRLVTQSEEWRIDLTPAPPPPSVLGEQLRNR